MKTRLLLFMMLIFSFGNAQINVNEGFESGALPSGWFSFGGGVVSSTTPISGSQSVFFSNTTSASGVKDLLTADYTSTGNAINISFLSKESGVAFVIYEVLYKINNTSAVSLGFETRASSAVPINNTYTIPAGTIPAGSLVDVTIRVGVMSGLTEFFVDDVVITQAALPIAPPSITALGVSSVTSTSAIINYNLSANNAATTSIVKYGLNSGNLTSQIVGFSASGNANTSGNVSINGLSPNTQYFYQVEATNSEGTVSSIEGNFTTLANPMSEIAEYNFDNTYNNILGSRPFTANTGTSFTTDRNGNANAALNLVSIGTTATIPNLPYDLSPRTISIWVKNYTYNWFVASACPFSYGTTSNTYELAIYETSFNLNPYSSLAQRHNVDLTPLSITNALNVWNHYVVSYDGTTSKIYKDGVLLSTLNVAIIPTSNNSDIFKLGLLNAFTSDYFDGAIDDLKIYNYALTDADVTSLYTNNTLSSSNFSQNNLEVALYPNPVHDILNIETALELQSVEIYNIQGQKVLSSIQKQINVSDLASGMYMVRIQDTDNNKATKKIVIK